LYAIPGLDYVAHEDILPYASTDKQPIQHELFEKFLAHEPTKDPSFTPKETLRSWQEKNHPWLELSDVHKETTENVRITVIPFYMGCRVTQNSAIYWVRLNWNLCWTRFLNCSLFSSRTTWNKVEILYTNGELGRFSGAVA
jgi:polymerase delta-interacting protein 2